MSGRVGAVVAGADELARACPGKVLAQLAGRPALAWVLERLEHAGGPTPWSSRRPTTPSDDAVAAFCAERGTACHRGPLDDVAARVVGAALRARPRRRRSRERRQPADRPAAGRPRRRDDARRPPDLVTNVRPRTFPPGTVDRGRVASMRCAARARADAVTAEDREHVTGPLYAGDFSVVRFASRPAPHRRRPYTLDTADDHDRLEGILLAHGAPPLGVRVGRAAVTLRAARHRPGRGRASPGRLRRPPRRRGGGGVRHRRVTPRSRTRHLRTTTDAVGAADRPGDRRRVGGLLRRRPLRPDRGTALEHGKHVFAEKPLVLYDERGARRSRGCLPSAPSLCCPRTCRCGAVPRFVRLRERIAGRRARADLPHGGRLRLRPPPQAHRRLARRHPLLLGRSWAAASTWSTCCCWLTGERVTEVLCAHGNRIATEGTRVRSTPTSWPPRCGPRSGALMKVTRQPGLRLAPLPRAAGVRHRGHVRQRPARRACCHRVDGSPRP